ncbi:MAG TPA: PQQ-binding-like beta-propeller repeat protein [Bryobacteraceae bacterium]|nr:PQQ-binding-like beta-propeller repeat protein [Bryobacteraceae bacterium]
MNVRIALCAAVLASSAFAQPASQSTGAAAGEWHYYGSDAHSTKYSPLDQINQDNVKQLQIAWHWDAANFSPRLDGNWEVTPLMVHGVLYFTVGTRRDAVAVDAATGETLWMYRLDEGERGTHAVRFNNRGLAYWTDGQGDERIIYISPGYHLVALNAKDGRPIPGFGSDGIVELLNGLDRTNIPPGVIGATSPPIVVRDVVVVGAALGVGAAPKSQENVPGYVRGYDVHTGKLLWTFHTIAQPGELGNNTWEDGSWKYTGNTAVWAPMSADPQLGYVYLPVEMPTGDVYGGARHGNNLFGDSLVCLDARTGKRIWFFQHVHHDMWDYDNPAAPVLVDITVDGKPIKAVAQVTKQAFVFVYDRVTGKPVWPIVEKPVPISDVPGEKSSPTQPFPTKPAAFDLQGVTTSDLVDFTPEIKAEALKIAAQYKLGPVFTPPIVYDSDGKRGTIQVPGAGGGANWQGAAADPETGMLYIPSVTTPYLSALVHDPKRSEMQYIARGGLGGIGKPMGLPLLKPPYGRITAIDLNTGDDAWMIPNGETPEDIKNNPALKGIDTSKFGGPGRAPLLVTKTLLFAGGGTLFRALDKKTGAVIFEMKLPANDTGGPMTFMENGRQYIVLAVSGRGASPELIALALPKSD